MIEHAHDLGDHPQSPQTTTPLTTTWILIAFSFWIGLGAWIQQFDQGYSGTVLRMKPFNAAFGPCAMLPDPDTGEQVKTCQLTATQQSLTNVYMLFIVVGTVLSAVTGHYLGRRGTIQIGCVTIPIGAAGMLGSSGNFLAYNACHCIGGLGLGHLSAAGPMYGVECAPARHRGLLLGLFNIGLALGQVSVSAVCLGSSTFLDDWAWKTPILCQIPINIIFCIGIMMFPESPRWLLTKGREEKARQAFARLYLTDAHSPEVSELVREVNFGIEFEKSLSSTNSWTEIFHKTYIRRTLISAGTLIGNSTAGIQFLGPYAALFLGGLGVKNPYLINVMFGCCLLGGSIVGPFAMDYLGRRLSLLIGFGVMSACMLIFASTSSGIGEKRETAKQVLVAFICIWGFTFGGLGGPPVWVVGAEVHSVRLRTYGVAFTTMIAYLFAFACTFWTPYMLNVKYGNMGTNIGYFFSGLSAITTTMIFLFVPETARLTLEQIDGYFASGRPAWKTSLARNKRIAKGEEYDVSTEVITQKE